MVQTRRSFLELAAAAAAAGVTVPAWRRPAAAAPPPARSCVLLYMEGGASQIDTFDPKPGRPNGGPFRAIGSAVAGIQVSEHLPGLARRMKQLCLIRSLASKEGNHDRARHLMHTGWAPQGGAEHPALGALVSEARGPHPLPNYVSIGGPGHDAGLLGPGHAPLPVLNPAKPTRNLTLARGVDAGRLQGRVALWRDLEAGFAARPPGPISSGHREVGERAIALMGASGLSAFDLQLEPEATRRPYGDSPFGAGCLMARRLVAEGVPFVEVLLRGWDTHEDNFPRVKALSNTLDRAMSALLDDLAARGLLESTLIVWMGDFGRTPVINRRGGRDHFPAASSVVLAGGGIRTGQAIGATSQDGDAIVERPVTVADLFRSLATRLGLDPDRSRTTSAGRPIKTVDGGASIDGLF